MERRRAAGLGLAGALARGRPQPRRSRRPTPRSRWTEEDDVVVRLTPGQLAGDHLVQLLHLEPVENSLLDRLDQVARLLPRLLAGVAADEGRARSSTALSSSRALGSFAPTAHERARS